MIVTGSLSVRLLVSHLDWRTFYTTKEWGGGGGEIAGTERRQPAGRGRGEYIISCVVAQTIDWLSPAAVDCRFS